MKGPAVMRALVVLALAWGVWRAMALMWVCDDAFISFRYARNLVDGLGLRFNAEESVEGYSNFLWTMLCALVTSLGIEQVSFAQWAGIACFAATVLVVARAGKALLPGQTVLLPVAAVGCALHRHLQEFASCGLETASFVLLTVLLLDALLRAGTARQWLLAGVYAALLGLTRPDGALFGALGGLAAISCAVLEQRLRTVVCYALPPFLAGGAFLLWKHGYYGSLLPNTFYAKSAAAGWLGQGVYFLALFFATYWLLLPALLALPALPALRPRERAPWLLAGFGLGYTAFVLWVGGDFMFARFMLPVVPVLYLALEWLVRRFLPANGGVLAVLATGVATLCSFQHEGLQAREIWNGIGDERAQYPAERVAGIREVGRRMRASLQGTPCRVVFFGTQAMLVYDAAFSYAMEGTTGLTDAHLARLQLKERGRVGHEKSIYQDAGYALQRRVHFLLERYQDLVQQEPWRAITLHGMPATIVIYDRALMAKLRGDPGIAFTDFEQHLDDYLAALADKTPAQVQADLVRFQLYYFAYNDDAPRFTRLQQFANGR